MIGIRFVNKSYDSMEISPCADLDMYTLKIEGNQDSNFILELKLEPEELSAFRKLLIRLYCLKSAVVSDFERRHKEWFYPLKLSDGNCRTTIDVRYEWSGGGCIMISGPHFELQYSVSFEEASALIDKIAKLLEAEFDKEYWLDIEGYQGHYRVSSMGRVRRMDRLFHDKKYGTVMRKGGVLELGRNSRGYLNVYLVIAQSHPFLLSPVHHSRFSTRLFVLSPSL